MIDIVERLDDLACILQWHMVGKVVCNDARAEIERLRSENERLRAKLRNKPTPFEEFYEDDR